MNLDEASALADKIGASTVPPEGWDYDRDGHWEWPGYELEGVHQIGTTELYCVMIQWEGGGPAGEYGPISVFFSEVEWEASCKGAVVKSYGSTPEAWQLRHLSLGELAAKTTAEAAATT